MPSVPDHSKHLTKAGPDKAQMTCVIIMPIHNEGAHLERVLTSYINQIHRPDQLILVNDGSTDQSEEIIDSWAQRHLWIDAVHIKKDPYHAPGAKIIKAFTQGFKGVKGTPDLIGKFDADIVLPETYFSTLINHFTEKPTLGMASGLLYIQKNNQWRYEGLAKPSKIRGPVKLYRKACFDAIDGLKPFIGWDSMDQWLAMYHGWEIQTYPELIVQHLKPTGALYRNNGQAQQGEAYAYMRYGMILTFLSLAKLAWFYKRCSILFLGLKHYQTHQGQPLVSAQQGKFIRRHLWRGLFRAK